jgi:hypothetical protein
MVMVFVIAIVLVIVLVCCDGAHACDYVCCTRFWLPHILNNATIILEHHKNVINQAHSRVTEVVWQAPIIPKIIAQSWESPSNPVKKRGLPA